MTPERAADWVRRWVALYTRGLPAEIQQGRRDEIDDDLWSQRNEAAQSGRTGRSLSGEIVMRLAFGIPADVGWRVEQHRLPTTRQALERHPTNGTRAVASLAIAGGIGWVVWPIPQAIYGDAGWAISPVSWLLFISVVLGTWALAGAMVGLVFAFEDRIRGGVALIGSLGASIGALSVLGAYLGILGLVLGSALLMWELGRGGVLGVWLSRAHVAAALVVFVVAIAILAFARMVFVNDSALAVMLLAPVIPYGFSWILIGWSLRHGAPAPERPAEGGMTRH